MTQKPTVSFRLKETPKRQAVGSNPAKCAKAPETKGCLRRSCLPMPAMTVRAPFSRAARGLLRTPPNDRRTRLNNRRKSSNNRRAAPNNRRKLLDNRRTPFNNRRKPSNNRRNFQTTKISIEITKELLRLPAENRRNVLPAAQKRAAAFCGGRGLGQRPWRSGGRAYASVLHASGDGAVGPRAWQSPPPPACVSHSLGLYRLPAPFPPAKCGRFRWLDAPCGARRFRASAYGMESTIRRTPSSPFWTEMLTIVRPGCQTTLNLSMFSE